VASAAGPPNLLGGGCTTLEGIVVVDHYQPDHPASVRAHRQMCGVCPVREACLAWALSREAGGRGWEGMYGGWSRRERQQILAAQANAA
jgi:hypothetical protein